MSDVRDAYLWVEIDHPSGQVIRGRMVAWEPALKIMAQVSHWYEGGPMTLLEGARAEFLTQSGIPEGAVADLSPGAMMNFIYRFFAQPPLAATKAPTNGGGTTTAPTGTATILAPPETSST